MNIIEFKNKYKPKKISSLKKFETEILELYNANYSLESITQFLKNNGINTTFQNVSRFIKSIDKDNTYKFKTDIKKNKSSFMPKLEKIGKDLDLKEAPDWAN